MSIKLDQYLEPVDEQGNRRSYPDFFRSAKEQLEMTTEELAKEIGCKPSRISEYLYGKRVRNPGLMTLGFIKRLLEKKEKGHA
jgi:transcriptional regulator with XRE-family HTH domain